MEYDIIFLDRADLATVVAADDPWSMIIAMIIDHDAQRVVCVTGTLAFVEVPFLWFQRQTHVDSPASGPGRIPRPNFRKARLACLGAVVYFGEYRINAATILDSVATNGADNA